jgi:hypothetical protein
MEVVVHYLMKEEDHDLRLVELILRLVAHKLVVVVVGILMVAAQVVDNHDLMDHLVVVHN